MQYSNAFLSFIGDRFTSICQPISTLLGRPYNYPYLRQGLLFGLQFGEYVTGHFLAFWYNISLQQFVGFHISSRMQCSQIRRKNGNKSINQVTKKSSGHQICTFKLSIPFLFGGFLIILKKLITWKSIFIGLTGCCSEFFWSTNEFFGVLAAFRVSLQLCTVCP